MKKRWMILLVGVCLLLPVLAHAQVDKFLQGLLGTSQEGVRPEQLTVTRLEFLPDPIPEGQRMAFRATVSNTSQYSVKLHLGIVYRDQIISGLKDIVLKPGDNQIDFPEAGVRPSGPDQCFAMDTIADRSRIRLNSARQFCASSTRGGWTLSDRGGDRDMAHLRVEDIEMYPNPVSPGQELRLKVRLSNDGRPLRGHILLLDRDQVVARIDNTAIFRGSAEYQFPRSTYVFQYSDACLRVSLDLDGTLYPVPGGRREYCVNATGWTLKPVTREHRDHRGEPRERGR